MSTRNHLFRLCEAYILTRAFFWRAVTSVSQRALRCLHLLMSAKTLVWESNTAKSKLRREASKHKVNGVLHSSQALHFLLKRYLRILCMRRLYEAFVLLVRQPSIQASTGFNHVRSQQPHRFRLNWPQLTCTGTCITLCIVSACADKSKASRHHLWARVPISRVIYVIPACIAPHCHLAPPPPAVRGQLLGD